MKWWGKYGHGAWILYFHAFSIESSGILWEKFVIFIEFWSPNDTLSSNIRQNEWKKFCDGFSSIVQNNFWLVERYGYNVRCLSKNKKIIYQKLCMHYTHCNVGFNYCDHWILHFELFSVKVDQIFSSHYHLSHSNLYAGFNFDLIQPFQFLKTHIKYEIMSKIMNRNLFEFATAKKNRSWHGRNFASNSECYLKREIFEPNIWNFLISVQNRAKNEQKSLKFLKKIAKNAKIVIEINVSFLPKRNRNFSFFIESHINHDTMNFWLVLKQCQTRWILKNKIWSWIGCIS